MLFLQLYPKCNWKPGRIKHNLQYQRRFLTWCHVFSSQLAGEPHCLLNVFIFIWAPQGSKERTTGWPGPSDRSCLPPCLSLQCVTYANPLLANWLQFYPTRLPQGTKPMLPNSHLGKILEPPNEGSSFQLLSMIWIFHLLTCMRAQ